MYQAFIRGELANGTPIHEIEDVLDYQENQGGEPMLVLSRKLNGGISIGDNVRITVVEIRGNAVRLGIEAPKEVPVHRLEVAEAIKRHEGRCDD